MVEIIPKPAQKLPLWQNILFYLSIGLLIASISSYFILDHFQKKAEVNLENLQEALSKKTPTEEALEMEISGYQKKIKDFSKILEQHLYPSKSFDYFQKLYHPKVWIKEFKLDSSSGELLISGQTDSFYILGQQTLIFKQENIIKSVRLSKLAIGEEGKINFTLNILLDPSIFQ